MLKSLLILLTAVKVICVPLFEDLDALVYNGDLNVPATISSTPLHREDEADPSNVPDDSVAAIDSSSIPNASRDSSNIPVEENEFESSLDNVADVCSSSLDNNEILRRQTCLGKKPSVHNPEKPGEGVTENPTFLMHFDIKTTSDPECVNFASRPEYVTCGGPEGYRFGVDQAFDSYLVYNCYRGMNLRCWNLVSSTMRNSI